LKALGINLRSRDNASCSLWSEAETDTETEAKAEAENQLRPCHNLSKAVDEVAPQNELSQ